jgi:hypothetical protein
VSSRSRISTERSSLPHGAVVTGHRHVGLEVGAGGGEIVSVYSTEPDSPTADALARLSTLAPAAVSEPWRARHHGWVGTPVPGSLHDE